MSNNETFLKVLYDGLLKHENKHINILFNVLAYMIFKKQIGNMPILELYENMYNKKDTVAFISLMKSKYNINIIVLEPIIIEKIIKMNITEIYIQDIISILNLKTLLSFL
jgi:hypothetical protein